jgi:hypothetical protein
MSCILTKGKVESNKNDSTKEQLATGKKGIEHVPDAISNAYAHNDPYILQNQAVSQLINFRVSFLPESWTEFQCT